MEPQIETVESGDYMANRRSIEERINDALKLDEHDPIRKLQMFFNGGKEVEFGLGDRKEKPLPKAPKHKNFIMQRYENKTKMGYSSNLNLTKKYDQPERSKSTLDGPYAQSRLTDQSYAYHDMMTNQSGESLHRSRGVSNDQVNMTRSQPMMKKSKNRDEFVGRLKHLRNMLSQGIGMEDESSLDAEIPELNTRKTDEFETLDKI